MALSQSALSELLDAIRAGGSADIMRDAMTLVLQQLIELEADQAIGAARYERTDGRTTHRNGTRGRLLSTKAGDVELRIPKLRTGSFFPALLEPRRRIDRALWAVVMEAYVHGVSTRKVDDLVAALGIDTGISKSEVSRICAELDTVVATFRDRPLGHTAFPYVFLDATYVKAHDGASVVSKAIVIATGVTRNGDREVLGLAVGDSEDGAFWTAFLRSLRARGLTGVRLVISDAHEGLKGAIAAVLLGSAWQRSSVHSSAGPLVPVSHRAESALAAAIGFRSSGRPAPPLGRRAYTDPRETCHEHRTMSVPGGLRRAARRTVEAGGQHRGGLRRARLGRAASPGPRTRQRRYDPALAPRAA